MNHYTAVEDLFIREQDIENTASNVTEVTAAEANALTYQTATNNGVYRLTTAGTVGGTAYAAGTYLKATIASTTLTFAVAAASDVKGWLESGVRDWKRWGRDPSKDLGICAWVHGAKGLTAGAATVTLESSADGNTFTAVASASGTAASIDRNGRLLFFLLPQSGLKQYVRVTVKVTTQFAKGDVATPVNLSVGLSNDAEHDIDASMVQPKIGG